MPTYLLRKFKPDDVEWLWQLYVETMREYIGDTQGWDSDAQRAYFDERMRINLPEIVVVEGKDVGMVDLSRYPSHLHLVQIEILPEWQGKGLGGTIIHEITCDAGKHSLPVHLTVLKANHRAKKLYEKLGFEVAAQTPSFYRMQKNP